VARARTRASFFVCRTCSTSNPSPSNTTQHLQQHQPHHRASNSFFGRTLEAVTGATYAAVGLYIGATAATAHALLHAPFDVVHGKLFMRAHKLASASARNTVLPVLPGSNR
jgi:hypothetical protein